MFTTRRTAAALMVLAAALNPAFGGPLTGTPPGLLVSTQWVEDNLATITLVDVRDPGPHATAHLPGAVDVKWKAFSDPAAAHPGNLNPDRAKLAQMLGALGISADRTVVIYSDPLRSWGEEGRMFWMLELLGHKQVAVMDGGFPKWLAEKRWVQSGAVAPRPATFVPAPVPERQIGWQEIQKRLHDPTLALIDTRTLEEYKGATPYGEARGGHIPGAIHLQWDTLLYPSGSFLSKPKLQAALAAQGLVPGRQNACYCTGGIRSGFVYFALRYAGYPRECNYDGSMWEWASHPELPLEK